MREYYNDFSDKCKLTKRPELLGVSGFGHRLSGKAVYVSRRVSLLGSSNKGKPSGKTEFVKQIDVSQIENEIKIIENEIKNLPVEHMYAILKSGKVYKSVGTSTNVTMEGIDFDGAIITHNHPKDETGYSGAFSLKDIAFLNYNSGITELRVVNNKYEYKLKLLKHIDISNNEIYRNGLQEKLNVSDFNGDVQHYICLWLKKKGYIDYVRINRGTETKD